eukprot:1015031-Amphidinium_carterae.1
MVSWILQGCSGQQHLTLMKNNPSWKHNQCKAAHCDKEVTSTMTSHEHKCCAIPHRKYFPNT